MLRNIPEVLIIAIILLAVTVAGGKYLLISFAEIEGVTVTIEYNIATILGVLLGGVGISVGGVAYAKRVIERMK
jgi:uncharacterized membrane protein YciS (DUF1049 family)